MPIEIRQVKSGREKRLFLTFPWRIYKGDPLWVPPLLPERAKVIDPGRGIFFKDGVAELFIAWQNGRPAGILSLAEDFNRTRTVVIGSACSASSSAWRIMPSSRLVRFCRSMARGP